MSWSKRGGSVALAFAAVAVVGALLVRRRRPEVWHTLPDTDQHPNTDQH
jgi:MYXO-CTERM domain-containing protein